MINKNLHYILIPILLVSVWQIISSLGIVSPIFIPRPYDVLIHFFELFKDVSILTDIGFTLYRVLVGFSLAVIIGVPLGLIVGYSNKIYNSVEFILEFFRGIPVTALFPLFLLFFGIGDKSKFAMTAWGAGLVIIVNAMYGVHLGKKLRMNVAKSMKIKGFDLFKKIIFPEALPQIFSGFRIAISLSLVIVIVSEMFVGTYYGLGKRIIDASLVYETEDMYVAIIITGIVGFLLSKCMITVENKVVHWKGR